jgi:ATP-dependent DNA ligase
VELSRREAARTAILYAFDLIEYVGEDLRILPFTEAGILLNEHIAEDGATVFAHACQLGCRGHRFQEGGRYLSLWPCRVWIKVRNPASIAVQRERSEIWNRRASGSGGSR